MTTENTTPTTSTPTPAPNLDGWAETYEDPDMVHHFTQHANRSTCGTGFWTGPRGDVSPKITRCADCQARL